VRHAKIDFSAPVEGPESGTAGLGPQRFQRQPKRDLQRLVCGHPIALGNDAELATTSLLLCDLSCWLTVGPSYAIFVFVLRAGHHTQPKSMHHVPSFNDSLPNGVTLFAASRTSVRWPASNQNIGLLIIQEQVNRRDNNDRIVACHREARDEDLRDTGMVMLPSLSYLACACGGAGARRQR
jgi:hypothetical protein